MLLCACLLISLAVVSSITFSTPNLEYVRQKENRVSYPWIIPGVLRVLCLIHMQYTEISLDLEEWRNVCLCHLPGGGASSSLHTEAKIRTVIKQGNCIGYTEKVLSRGSRRSHEINLEWLSKNLRGF